MPHQEQLPPLSPTTNSIPSSSPLLSLPFEILTNIFSFVYPPWHLTDVSKTYVSKHNQIWYVMRNYNFNPDIFELPGYPLLWDQRLDLAPLLVCKKLHVIAKKAYYTSFTGYALVSSAEMVDRMFTPEPSSRSIATRGGVPVSHLSVSLSWVGHAFFDVITNRICEMILKHGGRLADGDYRSMRIYCWKDYEVLLPPPLEPAPTPLPSGLEPTSSSLDRLLGTDEFDAFLKSETVQFIQREFRSRSVCNLRYCLEELIWCQIFDFGDIWDGLLVVDYEVQRIPVTICSDKLYLKRKRYVHRSLESGGA